MDNAPARSAELLSTGAVDAALVPVIVYQSIAGLNIVPDVCVGAREKVRSVCLITNGSDIENAKSVTLDVSSRTSVALTKILFREFFESEPVWIEEKPEPEAMLEKADAALIIGDPALAASVSGKFKVFDLVEVWKKLTGFGFVFAMWMTKRDSLPIRFDEARDEGLSRVEEIIGNYGDEISLSHDAFERYLTEEIVYSTDESMLAGLDLYFELAERHGLTEGKAELRFCELT